MFGSERLQWASVAGVCVISVLVGCRMEMQRSARILAPRPVYDFPRTTPVLDRDDCAYLAEFYRSKVASWTQTYFNMLVQRWNNHDERMGAIFSKVISAANRLDGGTGDYTITNDFFSFRAPDVVQFAPNGRYHTDCDFWKVEASDGFNLWILIDHDGLDTSFDVLERHRNADLYTAYDGQRSAVLFARNGSDPGTTFQPLLFRVKSGSFFHGMLNPIAFRQGHGDVLNWRSSLLAAFREVLMSWRQRRLRKRPEVFSVSGLNASNVRLSVGEAIVLREQELHRSDMHTRLVPGQFRLAAGFKLQRRNATIRQFDMNCPAQQDRFNLPLLWEYVGTSLSDIYAVDPGKRLVYMGSLGKALALLAANGRSLLGLALLAAAAARGKGAARVLGTAALAVLGLMGLVVLAQWPFFAAAVRAPAAGGRIFSAVK
mmetsp:Transcript_95976/g.280525  ORF Transcript_95976/g.280525 Transcript_95976/m.280525 type:complete len:430 (+) Transcript_95976:87-1376(+)